jgi:hypothetical protein
MSIPYGNVPNEAPPLLHPKHHSVNGALGDVVRSSLGAVAAFNSVQLVLECGYHKPFRAAIMRIPWELYKMVGTDTCFR